LDIKEYISSGIIESYILGTASAEEASIFECVLKNNEQVKQALIETQEMLENFALANAVKPPVELKDKIWNKIQKEGKVSLENKEFNPSLKVEYVKPKSSKNSTNWKLVSIAASLFLFISTAITWYNYQKVKYTEQKLLTLSKENQNKNIEIDLLQKKWNVISNPNMQTIALKGLENHEDSYATVFWNKETKEIYLSANKLPTAPEGMQYQLWAIVDGKPVSVGMYNSDEDTNKALAKIPKAQAFAITLEKQGGSKFPTLENMYVMGNI